MGRESLIRLLRSLHCEFPLDFTDEFLKAASLERLRHIILVVDSYAAKEASQGESLGCP